MCNRLFLRLSGRYFWAWEGSIRLTLSSVFLISSHNCFIFFLLIISTCTTLKTIPKPLSTSPNPFSLQTWSYIFYIQVLSMAAWNITQSRKYFRERKFPRSSLKYNICGHLYAPRLRLLYHPTQPVFFFFSLQHRNRLLFSQLNTWWRSWLEFQGHVVQKREREKEKCIFKHLNHTRMVRCSYAENSAGTETKRRNIRCGSPSARSPGAYALVGRGTDAPTLFTFFLSFSSWQSK